jgi:formylmethanofuran dehydrogenase subunit E
LGKGNIEKAGWGKLALTLIDKRAEKSVRVSYKPGRHKAIAQSAFMRKRGQGIPPTAIPAEEAWEMANIVWESPEDEVLTIGSVTSHPWEDDFGETMGLVPCSHCGELVAKAYLRVVGDAHMCISCSGYE